MSDEHGAKSTDLKIPEVAAQFRCSDQYVRDLCASGKLRGYKVGQRWRIPADAVDKYKAGRAR